MGPSIDTERSIIAVQLDAIDAIDEQVEQQNRARATQLEHLSIRVGGVVLAIMRDVYDGKGFPEEIAHLTTLAKPDQQFSYLKASSPFEEPDMPFSWRSVYIPNQDEFSGHAAARLRTDVGIAALYVLGGSAPSEVLTATLESYPLSIRPIHHIIDCEVIKVDVASTEAGRIVERLSFRASRIENIGTYKDVK